MRAQKCPTGIGILLTALAVAGCGGPRNGATYSRLREHIDSIKVISTHSHNRVFPEFEGHDYNFYSILFWSYMINDIASAGGPAWSTDIVESINSGDLDRLWETYGPWIEVNRATSYYGELLAGYRVLYGHKEPYFTRKSIARLSRQLSENYRNRDEWYGRAFREAGYELMIVDSPWETLNTEVDTRYHAVVFDVLDIIVGVARIVGKDAAPENSLFKIAEREGFKIDTLDDYLAFVEHHLEQFLARNVVALKNPTAYQRSLYYADVPYETAKELYAKDPNTLSGEDKTALQDFMFHWFIKKSIEHDLPIQIHTGYLADNGNVLENSRPILLNNLFLQYPRAKFVLFHGGYPWMGEYTALGKMFPNVYLDLCWLTHITREGAIRGLHEMLDMVPYNKLFWGDDCQAIEESAGALEYARSVVAEVLARRVDSGRMTEAAARDVALALFRTNAIREFQLEKRLGKPFE